MKGEMTWVEPLPVAAQEDRRLVNVFRARPDGVGYRFGGPNNGLSFQRPGTTERSRRLFSRLPTNSASLIVCEVGQDRAPFHLVRCYGYLGLKQAMIEN